MTGTSVTTPRLGAAVTAPPPRRRSVAASLLLALVCIVSTAGVAVAEEASAAPPPTPDVASSSTTSAGADASDAKPRIVSVSSSASVSIDADGTVGSASVDAADGSLYRADYARDGDDASDAKPRIVSVSSSSSVSIGTDGGTVGSASVEADGSIYRVDYHSKDVPDPSLEEDEVTASGDENEESGDGDEESEDEESGDSGDSEDSEDVAAPAPYDGSEDSGDEESGDGDEGEETDSTDEGEEEDDYSDDDEDDSDEEEDDSRDYLESEDVDDDEEEYDEDWTLDEGDYDSADDASCDDEEEDCREWSLKGECDSNPEWMRENCRESCFVCIPRVEDIDIGEEQRVAKSRRVEIHAAIRRAQEYLHDEVFVDPKYTLSMRYLCRATEDQCAIWAVAGECENNPGYMRVNCAPFCQSCDEVGYEARCPLDPNAPEAIGPGDLNALFERIVGAPEYEKYNVTVLSQPRWLTAGDEKADDPSGGPWVITFDDFVTPEECDRLVELGGIEGYERSTDVGDMNPDGSHQDLVSEGRTSENAWCSSDCEADPMAQAVQGRIAEVTGFPSVNSESLQLLRYKPGQFYERHHDFIDEDTHRRPGPRILTFFLYLNDVEAGGGTNFPELDLTVMPKKGKALLWPSVQNLDPFEADTRTDHQALPVEKGVKYGANAWLHLRDFKSANDDDCS